MEIEHPEIDLLDIYENKFLFLSKNNKPIAVVYEEGISLEQGCFSGFVILFEEGTNCYCDKRNEELFVMVDFLAGKEGEKEKISYVLGKTVMSNEKKIEIAIKAINKMIFQKGLTGKIDIEKMAEEYKIMKKGLSSEKKMS